MWVSLTTNFRPNTTREVHTGNTKTDQRRDTPRFALRTRGLDFSFETHNSLTQLTCGSRAALEGTVLFTKHLDSFEAFA